MPTLHEVADLRRQRPDLDRAGRGRRAARGPLERRVERRQIQNDLSAELRSSHPRTPVLHVTLTAADANCRPASG